MAKTAKKTPRKTLSKKIRFEVFKRDSFQCQYCGRNAPEVVLQIDHIEPIAKGGSNDIMNLVTSCENCNSGKGVRGLDDNSVVMKQKKQLDAVNERRVQLQMLVQWRNELREVGNEAIGIFMEAWSGYTDKAFYVNENGRGILIKLSKKYDDAEILSAMDKAAMQYIRRDVAGNAKYDSLEYAFGKIGPICYWQRRMIKEPQWKDIFKMIYGIQKRGIYLKEYHARRVLNKAYLNGVSTHELYEVIDKASDWDRIEQELDRLGRPPGDENNSGVDINNNKTQVAFRVLTELQYGALKTIIANGERVAYHRFIISMDREDFEKRVDRGTINALRQKSLLFWGSKDGGWLSDDDEYAKEAAINLYAVYLHLIGCQLVIGTREDNVKYVELRDIIEERNGDVAQSAMQTIEEVIFEEVKWLREDRAMTRQVS